MRYFDKIFLITVVCLFMVSCSVNKNSLFTGDTKYPKLNKIAVNDNNNATVLFADIKKVLSPQSYKQNSNKNNIGEHNEAAFAKESPKGIVCKNYGTDMTCNKPTLFKKINGTIINKKMQKHPFKPLYKSKIPDVLNQEFHKHIDWGDIAGKLYIIYALAIFFLGVYYHWHFYVILLLEVAPAFLATIFFLIYLCGVFGPVG